MQGYGQGAKDMREALKNTLKACNADPVRECEAINRLDPAKRTQQQCVTQGKLVAGSACAKMSAVSPLSSASRNFP